MDGDGDVVVVGAGRGVLQADGRGKGQGRKQGREARQEAEERRKEGRSGPGCGAKY